MLSWSTAFFLVSVAGVVIYLWFFCCEDDEEYNNSSALPTTTTWLLYQSSPPNSYSRGEVSASTTINYGNGTHRTSLTSHYVGETGQIPSTSNRAQASDQNGYGYRSSLITTHTRGSRETLLTSAHTHISHHPPQLASIRVSPTTTTDFTNDDVCRPRLGSPSSQVSPLTGPAPSLHPTHYCVHCSSSGHLGTNSSPRVVPNSSSPNPVPNARSGVEVGASANAQEMKTVGELREHARRRKREMHAADKLAKNARKNGDYRAEQRHRADAMVHESLMKVLDDRAAGIIFRENNKALQEGMVDLHGLNVPEAIEHADKEIESATYRRDDKVCFIIGKGLHADTGRSKLRPHLQELCDKRGLTYSLDPRNAGRLIVRLR